MTLIQRAGLFERVSTEEQAKYGYSIQTQIDALEEYCDKNTIKIVDHYCDEGVSAGKPYTKRPEMKRLIDDVKDKKIDIILFTRLDRWFRNVPEYFKVQEILDKHGVQWRAIWEDYDTTTANGRMAITIFLAIAQNEREKGSERIRSVFENKRKNKESFFGINIPVGYTEVPDENGITRLVKDPEVKEAMEMFWEIAVKYNSISKAARTVNLEYGITRPRHKWIELSKKEIYTGNYKGVDNYCPAYVSKEDWNKLINNGFIKNTQCNRVYLFTGLMKCPDCNRRMASKFTTKTLSDGTVKEYHHYRCPAVDGGNCKNNRTVSESKAEKWLLNNLEKLIKKEIARVEIERKKPRPKPKTNINALKEQLRRLNVTYMAGNKTDEEYIHEQNELKTAIKKAETELVITDADKDITALQKTLETDFVTIYKELSQDDKQRFWRTLISELNINENEIVSVDFN